MKIKNSIFKNWSRWTFKTEKNNLYITCLIKLLTCNYDLKWTLINAGLSKCNLKTSTQKYDYKQTDKLTFMIKNLYS